MTHVVDYAWTQLPVYAPRVSTPRIRTSPTPTPTTNYYWQVFPAVSANGTGANGVPGNGARPAFLKETIPPVSVAPLTGDTVGGDVTFKWLPVSGATKYSFEVSDDINFPTAAATAWSRRPRRSRPRTQTRSTTSRPGRCTGGSRRSTRRARGSPGRRRRRSPRPTIRPSFDTITNPTQGAMIPVLKWNPVPGAVSYDVDLICSMQGAVCTDGNGMETTAATMTRLTGIGVIGWRVRANFPGSPACSPARGLRRRASPARSPTRRACTRCAPAPASCSAGTRCPGPRKHTGRDLAREQLQHADRRCTFTTDNTSWAPSLTSTDYLNGGTFYWRVRTLDGDSNYGQPSPAQLMTLPAKLVETTSVSFLHRGTVNTVTVTVKDFAGHVIPGARVTASGAGLRAVAHLTGPKGGAVFKIKPTKTGYVNFVATKTGYQSVTKQLRVF